MEASELMTGKQRVVVLRESGGGWRGWGWDSWDSCLKEAGPPATDSSPPQTETKRQRAWTHPLLLHQPLSVPASLHPHKPNRNVSLHPVVTERSHSDAVLPVSCLYPYLLSSPAL